MRRAGLVFCAVALLAAPIAAQPSAVDRVENLFINGAIGGVSAAVKAVAQRKPLDRALLAGFGGGMLHGVGKQMAAANFDGSGILGRQVSSLGLGLVRAATRDTFVIPIMIGPVTLDVAPTATDRVRPRVNLTQVLVTLYYAAHGDTDLDVDATLSTAAPTFRRRGVGIATPWGLALGHMAAGTIVLGADTDGSVTDRTMRHESVHVLQLDYANEIVGFPLERAVLRRLPHGDRVTKYVDVGLMGHLLAFALTSIIAYERLPWEQEAYLLAGPWPGDAIDRIELGRR